MPIEKILKALLRGLYKDTKKLFVLIGICLALIPYVFITPILYICICISEVLQAIRRKKYE